MNCAATCGTSAHVADVPFVNFAGRDVPFLDEFPEPCGGFWIVFIVVVHNYFNASRGTVQIRKSGAPSP